MNVVVSNGIIYKFACAEMGASSDMRPAQAGYVVRGVVECSTVV